MFLEKRVQIDLLLKKGVRIPNPQSVDVGPEVDVDRISGDGVCLYAGTKIYGASTLILRKAKIGYEGPVTLQDCRVGPEVRLNGGYFKGAVFLKGAAAGSGAHVREGTILEEAASIAHTVGLKQTILFPFVTLGSLINFCDCLMSGGTGEKDHSEVGSSYIHFNYTPNQDKATASLLGDVPHGVMLREAAHFSGRAGRSGGALPAGIRDGDRGRRHLPERRTSAGEAPDRGGAAGRKRSVFCRARIRTSSGCSTTT